MTLLLLLLAQEEGSRTAEMHNPMGAHTWFIIFAAGAFLAWAISYSLQLHRETLARQKGREELTQLRDDLIGQIAELEEQNEAGAISEKQYKQELKELKFKLSKVLDRISAAKSTNSAN